METLHHEAPDEQAMFPRIAIVGLPERLDGPDVLALPPAPAEPDDLADWLDCQAAHYRVGGTGASALVARLLEREAAEVRAMSATTAAEYEARCEVMAEWAMEQNMSPEYFF